MAQYSTNESLIMTTNWEEQLKVDILSLEEAKQLIGDSDDYYVYILWKMYEKPPIPFYVGKGHLGRITKHHMPSEATNNKYKGRIVKKHQKQDVELGYSVCNFFKNEITAWEKEMEIIALIGRHDLNKGPLANISDGGDGASGYLARKRGDSASARPVIAGGKRYACVNDAADALKITSGAVTNRIKEGWPDFYFEDEGQKTPTKKLVLRYKKRIVAEGKEFESLNDAARALGRDVRQIHKRINSGWEGYYYIDEGQQPRKTVWGSRTDKVAVLIHDKHYPTIAEAVKQTGESDAMIRMRCLSSNFPEYSRVDGKEVKKSTPPKFPVSIQVEGRTFESRGEAARFYNISTGTVDQRCRNANLPDWQFTDKEKQKRESHTPKYSSKPEPVTIKGRYFKSLSSAAAYHEVDIATLKRRCGSPSFPTWQRENIKKVPEKDGRPSMISIIIDGKEYRSISQASKTLDIPRLEIKKRIESDAQSGYQLLHPRNAE